MPVYLSASSIADFIKCPQRVLYRITKQVQEAPTKEQMIGRLVHTALESGWKTRTVAMELALSNANFLRLSKADKTNISFMIDVFFLNFRNRLSEGDKIEYSFKLQLFDDVFLVGKMDRISDGNIYDWKTSVNPPKSLSNDVQSMIYRYAYKTLFGDEPKSVCVASLTKGVLIPYTPVKIFEDGIFNHVIPRMIKTVKNSSFERLGMFNGSCYRCSYKHGCLGKEEDNVMDSTEPTHQLSKN